MENSTGQIWVKILKFGIIYCQIKSLTGSAAITQICDIYRYKVREPIYLKVFVYSLFPGLWGLVNNAGIMPNYCPAELISLRDYKKICDVNLFGSINVTLTFLPLIRKAQLTFVNVCSVVANIGLTATASYSISKSGLRMFSTCLR